MIVSSHGRGAADSKNFLSSRHEELARYHQRHHPTHDFEGVQSRNPTNTSMRQSLLIYKTSILVDGCQPARNAYGQKSAKKKLLWDDSKFTYNIAAVIKHHTSSRTHPVDMRETTQNYGHWKRATINVHTNSTCLGNKTKRSA